MKRLLSIELQKIWQNRASRILTLTYFILLSSIALISSINFKFIGVDFRLADMGIYNFPFIWHFNTFMAALFKFFLAIIIVSMMANEYSNGTLKQNLIDGLNKKEFILSKFLTVVLFALISTVYIFIITLILGYSFSSYDETSIVFMDLEYLFAYFLKLTAFFSFCLFLGILVKRSAFALGFLFVWFIFECVLIYMVRIPKVIYDLLPLEAMYRLISQPFTRFKLIQSIESQVSGANEVRDYGVHLSTVIIVSAWVIIFMLMSYNILKKRDL